MVAVVVFEFSVMRCQPLRRALCVLWEVKCNILINCLK
ncbi:acetyltransferase [Vibrio cholerae]|nr:acetyltransferase [Vibrio cholerae]QHQ92338.1 acetyltransferase [Vibrio cholerae O1]EGR4196153.1 acetyltransferase [Vibrio cholerae]KAA1196039.1 acetyltransferase [Vibrio cholerae]MVB20490.1 acetyltransferase [Vibrio cholerae]